MYIAASSINWNIDFKFIPFAAELFLVLSLYCLPLKVISTNQINDGIIAIPSYFNFNWILQHVRTSKEAELK